ncbi:ABC transporter permease [Abyssalbus ytuae]|uniref:FtsX-like permease family protein n=1 Tax=Abyssalbus ytuae TaxID=2926907 RepID=A0A9E7D048_9FLAO|nr:FtsX-like permease family protein [Abyssalbus ytuae]UOB18130.1 FtsX-like permease family protein [Abyssalbus ytuae]
MINSTNFKIAYVHLTSRVKQLLVAVLSVTFGISMYVFMNSFMGGINQTQTKLAFSVLAHIDIYNDMPAEPMNLFKNIVEGDTIINVNNAKIIQHTKGIQNTSPVLNDLQNFPGIKAVTTQLNSNVTYRNGSTSVNGSLSGIEVENEDKLFNISQYMTEGEWKDLNHRSNGIIVGKILAKRLSTKLGDNIMVTTQEGISKNYRIVGIIETTIGSVDKSRGYIKIASARQLFSKNMDYASDIQINVTNYENARKIASRLKPYVPYTVESWQESNGQLEAANSLRNIIALAVSLTILLVAGFGIYNIMNMTVNEKIKEIAILKAMGFDGRDIIEIFLTQSVIIGVLGGFVGLILGYGISIVIDNIPFKISSLSSLPIIYRPRDYAMAFIFGLIVTFIAGYLPAKKASNVDPVEIIRG